MAEMDLLQIKNRMLTVDSYDPTMQIGQETLLVWIYLK